MKVHKTITICSLATGLNIDHKFMSQILINGTRMEVSIAGYLK